MTFYPIFMIQLPKKAIFHFFLRNLFISPLLFLGLAYVISTPMSTYFIDGYGVPNEYKLLIAILAGFIVYISLSLLCAFLKQRTFSYEIDEKRIEIKQGVLWRSITTIPIEKIQNIDIQRSMTARMLGLSTILIQTAGASIDIPSEGVLPGLEKDVAVKLRDQLLSSHHIR